MWLGELITERGIGNGISFIIFAGIVSQAPGAIAGFVDDPEPGTGDRLRDPRDRVGGGDHLHPGRPASDPDPVREPRPRPADVPGRPDVPAAPGQPGRRDPDHLRDQHPALPAADRLVLHRAPRSDIVASIAQGIVAFFNPQSIVYVVLYFLAGRRVHLLLHGVHVQTGRDRRAAPQERRVHPGHPARPARRPTTSPGSSPGSRSPAPCSWASSRPPRPSSGCSSRRSRRSPSVAPAC